MKKSDDMPTRRNRIWIAVQLAYAGYHGKAIDTLDRGHYRVIKHGPRNV
jgi:hypothetical protein